MAEHPEINVESAAHLLPSCVACTYLCNRIHGNRDLEGEKFDPDRSWPFFRKKVSKLSVHQAPQSAICIPPAFMEDYPNAFQRGRPITLEGPSGYTWRVEVVDRSVLHLGWRAFAHDNRLQEGDVLDFTLTKPSHFVVDIFNGNGDVRRSARGATVTGQYLVAPKLQDIDQAITRKRKLMETGDGHLRMIPDHQRKTPAATKRRAFGSSVNGVEHMTSTSMGTPLKFCEKTKQWTSHAQDIDRREVVNLDSDDDDEASKIVHMKQRETKPGTIGRRVEVIEGEKDGRKPPVINFAAEKYQVAGARVHDLTICDHGEENHIAAHEQRQEDDDDYLDEDSEELASNPISKFTTMFDRKPRRKVFKEDILVVEKPAIEEVKSGIPNTDSVISEPLSQQARNNVTIPVTKAGRRESHELATELDTLKLSEDGFSSPQSLTKSGDTTPEENVQVRARNVGAAAAVTAVEEVDMVAQDVPKSKVEVDTELNATYSDSEATPDASPVTESKTRSKPTLMTFKSPESPGACVLISKRGRVDQVDRDRALQAAQARATKLHNPNFVAVMNHTNVYTDFNMDVPAEFVEQSKMPSEEVRVTLTCDVPPTNCKVVWKPLIKGFTEFNHMAYAKLSADGWMDFSRSHFLEEGDVCVFENLNKYPAFRIGVHIFRVVELKEPVEALDWERHYEFGVGALTQIT